MGLRELSRLWMLEAYWSEGGSLTDRVRTSTYPNGLTEETPVKLVRYYARNQVKREGMRLSQVYTKEIE